MPKNEKSSIKILTSFDFDHTLFEYQPPRHEVFAAILEEEGLSITADHVLIEEFFLRTKPPPEYRVLIKQWPQAREQNRLKIILQGRKILIRRLFSNLAEKKVDHLTRVIEEASAELLSYNPVPEARDVLQRLKNEGIPMVINSGNVRSIIESHLEAHDLKGFFDYIIAVDTHTPRKRENFQYVLEKSQNNGMKVVHVGDEPNTDYFAPKSRGIHSYLVARYPILHRYVRELYPGILERDIFPNLKEPLSHVLRFARMPSLFDWDVVKNRVDGKKRKLEE